MKKIFYHILIFTILTAMACNDPVYSDYSQSPIKSIECSPLFMPLSVSDGAVVTIEAEGDTNTYRFIKIDKNAELKYTTFKFNWNYSELNNNNNNHYTPGQQEENHDNNTENNENENSGNNENQESPETNTPESKSLKQTVQSYVEVVDISSGSLKKNSNDEYFFDFYSSNTFGREYYAVVKFDKDCNIIFQIDSTVNAMGGNQNSVSKMPVAGTPLDNGGYAMIFQTPSMGMMQATSYDLTLKIINSQGEIESTSELEFSETVSVKDVMSIDNNIFISYENSSSVSGAKIFSIDGELLNEYTMDNTISKINFLTYKEYGYISGYNSQTQKFTVMELDKNGNILVNQTLDSVGVFIDITEVNNKICLSGFTQSNNTTTYNSINSYLNYISNLNGLIVLIDLETTEFDFITADYDLGVIIYSTHQNSDGTYTVFLSQVTPLDAMMSSYNYGQKIYVYQVDDLKNLQIN